MDTNKASDTNPVKHRTLTKNQCMKTLRGNLLLTLTVISIVVGFALGFALRLVDLSDDLLMWLKLPGELFLSLLRMTIVPVITCSVVVATAQLNAKENGKIGSIMMAWLVTTNLIGAAVGLALAYAIRPGDDRIGLDETANIQLTSTLSSQDLFVDFFRNFIPDNIVQTTLQKKQTSYVPEVVSYNASEGGTNVTVTKYTRTVLWANDINIVGLIVVSIIFGAATSSAGSKGKAFLDFFKASLEVVLIVLRWCIWFSPIGVVSLILGAIVDIDDLGIAFSKLGLFVATVVSGLVIHQVVLIPFIYGIFTRRNPYRIYRFMIKPWLIAFSTASSACCLPYIYEAVARLGVSRRVTGVAVPIAVSLSADGSGLFICAAVIFLAQLEGAAIGVADAFTICFLTGISTMALPSVPSASLVTIIIICTSLGIPTTNFGLLFAVEWFLDRVRTTSNVVSEVYTVVFIEHFCGDNEDPDDQHNKDGETRL